MNKKSIELELNIQNENLKVLQEALKNINSIIQETENLSDSGTIVELLKEAKENLDFVRANIVALEKLKNYFDTGFSEQMDKLELDYLLSSIENDIRMFYSKFNKFIFNYITSTTFLAKELKHSSVVELKEEPLQIEEKIAPDVQDNYDGSANTSGEYSDNNVLLISKLKNKVFLPYKIKELTSILGKSRKYRDIREVINDRYVVSIDRYKNPTISRFKEAFNLMRKKEKASIIDSLDLAIDVAFNSKLYPAVITACRNLEELDTYLDYLELNELDKFEYFKVKYEFYPTAS